MGFLRVHPELWCLAEVFSQRDRRLRAHAASLMNNLVQSGRRYVYIPGDTVNGEPQLPDLF